MFSNILHWSDEQRSRKKQKDINKDLSQVLAKIEHTEPKDSYKPKPKYSLKDSDKKKVPLEEE